MSNKLDRELVVSQEVKDINLITAQDFFSEFFRRVSEMPSDLQQKFEYSLGFQDKGIKMDAGSGVMEIIPGGVEVKMTPFESQD